MPTPVKSPSGRYFDWNAIVAKARKADGEFVLAVGDQAASVLDTIRGRRHRDLQRPDGYLLAELRNRHEVDGKTRGDLFVAWNRARR